MLIGISNDPRPYHWGSRTVIAELLGRTPTDEPAAELWLGAHPGSPSRVLDPSTARGAHDLAEFTAPEGLPFLLKILSAEQPLSLQAHPSLEQARDGFEAENSAGLPIDDPSRNYKDALHKPELIVALSETFRALSGFRPLDDARRLLTTLLGSAAGRDDAPDPAIFAPLIAHITAEDPLRATVDWLLRGREEVAALTEAVVALAAGATDGPYSDEFHLVGELDRYYPGDPGVVLSLLLNYIVLPAGEALFLPAGNIHAYVEGTGVELMAASDNVLRGGLTSKHIDVPELISVLDFQPLPAPYLPGLAIEPGVTVFRPELADFQLYRFDLGPTGAAEASLRLEGPAIAITTTGEIDVLGGGYPMLLGQGRALFATDEERLSFRGEGTLFLATVGPVALPVIE